MRQVRGGRAMETETEIRGVIERIHEGQSNGDSYYFGCDGILMALEWVVGDADEPV